MSRNPRGAVRALLLVALSLATNSAFAQSPAPLALPNQPLRISGVVYDAAVLPDGRRIVLGSFKWVHGEATSGALQRLRADGRLDRSWNPPDIGPLYGKFAADEQGNAYVIAGGSNRITKFSHIDGSVVPEFQATATQVGAIQVKDGFLYASGRWEVPGRGAANLVRLSLATGAADPTFAPDLEVPWTGIFTFDPQGRVYIRYGAGFKRVSQEGVVDPSWSGAYLGNTTEALAATDDAVYVAVRGEFPEAWHLRKLRATDGSLDSRFNVTTRGEIWAIHLGDAGAVWIGGQIKEVNSTPLDGAGLARLQSDGSLDVRTPYCLCGIFAIEPGRTAATLELYGVLGAVVSEQRLGVAAIDAQGRLLPEVTSLENPGEGSVVVRQPDGRVLVGGQFQKVGSHKTHHVARFNVDGTIDRSFVSSATTTGRALAVSPVDGSIFVGGHEFRDGRLDKLDPQSGAVISEWTVSVSYPGVDSLLASSDGFLYVGGAFGSISGASRQYLGRVSQSGSGTLDLSWAPQPAVNRTLAILEDAQGTLFVGQVDTGRVSRYDRASGTRLWDVPTTGLVSHVARIGTRLFVSGMFCVPRLPNPSPDQRCGVVRLDAATGAVDLDWQFSPSVERPGEVFSGRGLSVTAARELIAGGYFLDDGFTSLWRVDPAGNGTVVAGWRPTATGIVRVLADAPNRVWVAGNYQSISGVERFGVAAVPLDQPDAVVFSDGYE